MDWSRTGLCGRRILQIFRNFVHIAVALDSDKLLGIHLEPRHAVTPTTRKGSRASGLTMSMKLWFAYGMLILVAIVVATIALLGFYKSRFALDELRQNDLPEIATALELADQSSTLAAFAPFLGSVRVRSQLDVEGERLMNRPGFAGG